MCVVPRYGSIVIGDHEGIKFIDIQTGRVCSTKQFSKNELITALTTDVYAITLFVGLNDGRIMMYHLPDLNSSQEVGRHSLKPKNLFKSIAMVNNYTVNKLQVLSVDKNVQPDLYSCSNDGSVIQRSLIYYQ